MKAFVSGQLGLAASFDPKSATIAAFTSPLTFVHCPSQVVARFFDGASDVRSVSIENATELERATRIAWAEDRCLRLTLFLIEAEDPLEDLIEFAECVEELIVEYEIEHSLLRSLLSRPLPVGVQLNEAIRISRDCSRLNGVLESVDKLQPIVAAVSDAFEQIPLKAFEDIGGKIEARNRLRDSGCFYEFVIGLSKGEDLSFAVLKIKSHNRALSLVIDRWLASFGLVNERRAKDWKALEDEYDGDDDYLQEVRIGQSYGVYLQVRSQQHAILEKLRTRDLAAARKLCDEMIGGQRSFSTAEQTAKSLCAVAQIAKSQGIPELQCEWAEWATRVNPADPRTFGHYADALLALGRFGEAKAAFNSVESAGDACFGATGQARVLRNMGHLIEARRAFLDVGTKFADHEGVEFALILAAETLRDMSDVTTALSEYQGLAARFPNSAAVWAGLASCLMDAGRFDDAIVNFGRSEKHRSQDGGLVAKNGRATAYKLSGRFDEALKIYDEILIIAPNDYVGHCGRADTLRASGRHEEALAALNTACERAPFAVSPFANRANLLVEMRRFREAANAFADARERFPFDRGVAIGRAVVLKRSGKYSEALAAYDDLIASYPFDFSIRAARANILCQLGFVKEAIEAYDVILAARPYMTSALLGRASTLIRSGRAAEVLSLIDITKPKSLNEWRLFSVKAFAMADAGTVTSASRMFERGIKFCPFASERRVMRSALASLKIQTGKAREAAVIVDVPEAEISNIVQLHAYAAAKMGDRALAAYQTIKNSEPDLNIILLADEIARRHRLRTGEREHSNSWIRRTERAVLLFEAA